MNLLDNRTIGQLMKAHAETKRSNVAKSPNMAVSGVTGKGDYPVKPAVKKTTTDGKLTYDASGKAIGFNKEYYNTPESIAKRKKADADARRKEENKKYDLGIFN
jgi:hypothetical protein